MGRNITIGACNIPAFFFALISSMQEPIANKVAKLGKSSGKLYNLPGNIAILPDSEKCDIETEAQQTMRQTMKLPIQKSWKSHPRSSLFVKAGAILMLFVLSVMVVA